jgi:hypothetical protein
MGGVVVKEFDESVYNSRTLRERGEGFKGSRESRQRKGG